MTLHASKFLTPVLLSGAVLICQPAAAADGTISFTGSVTAQTCTISGNGTGSKDFTVPLPTVSSSTLSAAGKTGGRSPFNIRLTACTPSTGNVMTYFEPGPTTDASSGYLKVNSGTGTASNVQIRLLNKDFSVIKAGFAAASQNSQVVPVTSGSATLEYFAEYVATGAASAGTANSSVMYTIAYQ